MVTCSITFSPVFTDWRTEFLFWKFGLLHFRNILCVILCVSVCRHHSVKIFLRETPTHPWNSLWLKFTLVVKMTSFDSLLQDGRHVTWNMTWLFFSNFFSHLFPPFMSLPFPTNLMYFSKKKEHQKLDLVEDQVFPLDTLSRSGEGYQPVPS